VQVEQVQLLVILLVSTITLLLRVEETEDETALLAGVGVPVAVDQVPAQVVVLSVYREIMVVLAFLT
jgi:hypothetical protein